MKSLYLVLLLLGGSALADYLGLDCAKVLPEDPEEFETEQALVSFTATCLTPDLLEEDEQCEWTLQHGTVISDKAFAVRSLIEGKDQVGYEVLERLETGVLAYTFKGITSCDGADYKAIKLTRTDEQGTLQGDVLECSCYTF